MHGHASNNHSQCLCSVHAVHCVVQKNNREKELLKLQRVQQQQEEECEKDMQRHKGCSAKIANLEARVKQQRQVKLKRRLAFPRQNTWCAILTFLISQIIEEMERALELRQGNEKSGKKKMTKGMEVGKMSREQCAFKKIMVKNSLHAVKANPSTERKRGLGLSGSKG